MSEATPSDALEVSALPTLAHLLLEAPLYAPFGFSDTEATRNTLKALRRDNFQFDAHCIHCAKSSTFKTSRTIGSGSGSPVDLGWMFRPTTVNIELICLRENTHVYRYYVKIERGNLKKIGQWPSLEDIAGADIEKYRAQLKGGYFRELKVATGLASHGVGIGAFVYLRRIFERLIYQHHEELPEPIENFSNIRMDEKIESLRDVLPPALVKNKSTYAILSKGLHELDEKACQLYFPVVRSAIIQILEQDFQARATREAEVALEREIAEIARQLK